MTAEGTRQEGVSPVPPISAGLPDGLLLLAASYEERCGAVLHNLSSEYRARRILIYVNTEFLGGIAGEQVTTNLTEMAALAKDRSDSVEVVQGSWLDSNSQLKALRVHLGSCAEGQFDSATVDATTFTRESLIVACALLRNLRPEPQIRIAYASPLKHGDWLSRHYRLVRNIMGFPGVQRPALPTVLIILSGFEQERAGHLIEEHEPARVFLGIGNPPVSEDFLQRNLTEQKLILARQGIERFEFPTNSIQACVEALEATAGPLMARHNVVLAPMSTKLSSLACMIFAERHPEVQLSYCLPGEYNTQSYSSGVRQIFLEELTRRV